MKKLKRIIDVFTKEGLYTFTYLVKTNLRTKHSPEKKYKQWRKVYEQVQENQAPVFGQPFFSVLVMGFGKDEIYDLKEKQTYESYEVIAVDRNQTLQDCLEKAKGSYIAFLQSGDLLAKDALAKVVHAIENPYYKDKHMFYSDEDVMSSSGERMEPFFKPDYSPDTLRSFFYMGGLLVLSRELLEKLTFSLEKPLMYGAYLPALEASLQTGAAQVQHLPEILYHRRNLSRPDVQSLAKDKKELFQFYGIDVATEEVEDMGEVRVLYRQDNYPKVSIVIPSKDNPKLLKLCLDSIARYTRYPDYELVIIDNGSSVENKKIYEQLCQAQKVECRYYHQPMEFNFSKMCNMGAEYAKGDYYLFLNDDIEIKNAEGEDWLSRLMGQAVQSHCGAVGAKLLYPDSRKIQHVGVVNYESGAAHILSKAEDDRPLLFGRNRLDYNYSIVTGACFLVSRAKFEEAGGFEEKLAVTFNDVELCFRLLKKGYYNVVRNDVVLYHHESITRGEDAVDAKKFLRHLKEREKLFAMHPSFVKRDCFYSKHLTQKELDGAVNVEYKPEEFETEVLRENLSEGKLPLTCIIEFAEAEEKVCISGFAFSGGLKHNNLNKTYVVLKGKEETILAKTMRIYNPTIAPQMESKKNLNFASFYTSFSREKLHEDCYELGVAIRPFASGTKHLKMTGRKLRITGNTQL